MVQNVRDDRVAYRICRLARSMVEHVTRLCVNDHSCVNASAQYAALAALKGPQDEVHRMIEAFDQRRQTIVAALNDLPNVRCADAAGPFMPFQIFLKRD